MSAVLRLRSVGSGLGCAKRTLALSTVSRQKSKFGSDSEAAKTKAVVFDIGGVIVPSSMPFLIGEVYWIISAYHAVSYWIHLSTRTLAFFILKIQ